MEIISHIETLLLAILGCSTLVGFVLYRRASLRIKDAEAALAQAKADTEQWGRYEKQLDHSSKTIEILHNQVETDATRIATLNKALDDKTDRIRELTDKALLSEGLLNSANRRIAKLTEERDNERLMKERYKEWHCQSAICREGKPDPKGRRPPNPRIFGKKFSLRDVPEAGALPESQQNTNS